MTMSFRITGVPSEHFAHLFGLSDEELRARGVARRIADGRTPGYPCRISLTDSQQGDELLLVNYEHHAVDSPYRMRFASTFAKANGPTTPSMRCQRNCVFARLPCVRSMPQQ